MGVYRSALCPERSVSVRCGASLRLRPKQGALLFANSLVMHSQKLAPNQKYYSDLRRRDIAFSDGDVTLGPVSGHLKAGASYLTTSNSLPPCLRAHNVVHFSKLKPHYRPEHDSGPLNVTIEAMGTVLQEVSNFLAKKREKGHTFYLVLFEGDDESEAEWLLLEELETCADLVKECEASTRTSMSKKG